MAPQATEVPVWSSATADRDSTVQDFAVMAHATRLPAARSGSIGAKTMAVPAAVMVPLAIVVGPAHVVLAPQLYSSIVGLVEHVRAPAESVTVSITLATGMVVKRLGVLRAICTL